MERAKRKSRARERGSGEGGTWDTKESHERGPRAVHGAPNAQRGRQLDRELQKQRSSYSRHAALRAASHRRRGRARSPPQPSPESTHPPQPSRVVAPRRRREATLAPIVKQLPIHPHPTTSTCDAHQDVPTVEDPVPLMDAHRSQARIQSALLHLIPVVEDRLPRIVLGPDKTCKRKKKNEENNKKDERRMRGRTERKENTSRNHTGQVSTTTESTSNTMR